MNLNDPQLAFLVKYRDGELLELEVTASNGKFAGFTNIYLDDGQILELRNKLRGFPNSIEQVIEHEFGFTSEVRNKLLESQFPLKYNESFVGLKFYCLDRKGHTALDLVFVNDPWIDRDESVSKSSFALFFEPASLDQFVHELTNINNEGKAILFGKMSV